MLGWGGIFTLETELQARSIYFNGIDISSARSQTLKKVNVRIDEHGNVFLEGEHYRVHHEAHYTPLSKWLSDAPQIKHRPRQTISSGEASPVAAPHAAASQPEDLLEKVGEKR